MARRVSPDVPSSRAGTTTGKDSTILPESVSAEALPLDSPPVVSAKPPLSTLISSYDFEKVASQTLSKKTWAFYSSAATDEITRKTNKILFDRIWFRPRVMRDVKNVDTSTRILGCNVNLPFYISPAAMAKLVHPDGELAMARGCAEQGIAQCVCIA